MIKLTRSVTVAVTVRQGSTEVRVEQTLRVEQTMQTVTLKPAAAGGTVERASMEVRRV